MSLFLGAKIGVFIELVGGGGDLIVRVVVNIEFNWGGGFDEGGIVLDVF
jgi:hypothetical protein